MLGSQQIPLVQNLSQLKLSPTYLLMKYPFSYITRSFPFRFSDCNYVSISYLIKDKRENNFQIK